MIKIRTATYLDGWKLQIIFSTGECGIFDMESLVHRPGSMVAPLRDAQYFQQFFLELGALAWPNRLDITASSTYHGLREQGKLRDHHAD